MVFTVSKAHKDIINLALHDYPHSDFWFQIKFIEFLAMLWKMDASPWIVLPSN